jgi:hypothetical protein
LARPKKTAEGPESKPRRRRKTRRQKPQGAAAPLPPPIPVQDVQPAQQPLGEVIPFSAGSAPSSTPTFEPGPGDPLTPEQEHILADVPQFIGDAPATAAPGDQGEPGGGGEDDAIAALMAQVAFEPQDVQDTICEFFEWLAERFQSHHWKLSDRQARMLGKPSAILANAMWSKLSALLPDIIGQWCESTPGATAFLFAFGIVVVPKVKKQFSLSRERARERAQTVRPMTRPAVPVASPGAAQAVPTMQ